LEIPKQRVLIVDDSKIVRTTLARLIRSTFDVREEANGELGWQAVVSDKSVVAVLSDIQMPGLDGFALLERIRNSAEERVRTVPVIMISGNEDDATKKRAREAGANDFITKTTDGTEILSRIDNLLHLVEAKQQLAVNREAVEQTVTHDALTGAFTPHYLIIEGRKHYSHARRHGGLLSVMVLRIDSHDEIAQKVGKSIADQLLARIAKLVMGTLRVEDSMGRTGEASFTVFSAGSSPQQALAFASRLQGQLEKSQVTYREHVLKIRSSIGLASLDADPVASIEELMRLASQRLHMAASRGAQRIVAREEVSLVRPPTLQSDIERVLQVKLPALPGDIERAVQVIEAVDAERLGGAASVLLRRLLPFLQAVCKHLNVELPVDKIRQALKGGPN
jgi:two-component system cell cycle response regulator